MLLPFGISLCGFLRLGKDLGYEEAVYEHAVEEVTRGEEVFPEGG